MSRHDFHKKIVIGTEIEAYSINVPDYYIGRGLSRPKGISEFGEKFSRDASIGSEYNSRPFTTIREAFFLLKSGLRKYLRNLYRSRKEEYYQRVPLLVGGWTNRFAGTHFHMSIANKILMKKEAASLSAHIHDHIPFLITIGANSPVWDWTITNIASNRIMKGGKKYFTPVKRGELTSQSYRELVYNRGRITKPPTLELRVLDSNIPEFIVAKACILKAIGLHWLKHKGTLNRINNVDYLRARRNAAKHGMKARLFWRGRWISATKYLDKFLWNHRDELECMDIPEEIYEVLRLLKKGYNGSRIIYEAAVIAKKEHPHHRVHINAGTHLSRILKTGNISVNTEHHQAVKDIAPGFIVSATAEDGLVEGIETHKYPQLITVQWHPERQLESRVTQKLFKYFVKMCAAYKHKHRK